MERQIFMRTVGRLCCLCMLCFLTAVQSTVINTTSSMPTAIVVAHTTSSGPTSITSSATTTSMSTTTATVSTTKTTIESVVCQNGGTSSDNKCTCLPGYEGRYCESPLKVCQNGGVFDGIKCRCTMEFYGPLCEYVVNEVGIDSITAEVLVEVRITNQPFDENLTNTTTNEYKEFDFNFKMKMDKAYSNVPGFKELEITSIRQGSIIVDHKVILELKVRPNIQDEYKEVVMAVKEQLMDFMQTEGSCKDTNQSAFCFDMNSTAVTEVKPPTENELCQQRVPAEFANFYFPHYSGSNLTCVSYCTSGVPAAIDCNYGECRIVTIGPRCFCSEPDTYWYSGENCNSRTNKIAVYGGFGGALGILLVVIVTITFLWQRSRRRLINGGPFVRMPQDIHAK